MRKIALGVATVLLFSSTIAWARVPDPRDSIILESKTVAPGAFHDAPTDTAAYVYLRMWITNKDTIVWISLPLEERSLSNGAYLRAGHPRLPGNSSGGTINHLTSTLPHHRYALFTKYNSSSPDTFLQELSNTYVPCVLLSRCHRRVRRRGLVVQPDIGRGNTSARYPHRVRQLFPMKS